MPCRRCDAETNDPDFSWCRRCGTLIARLILEGTPPAVAYTHPKE